MTFHLEKVCQSCTLVRGGEGGAGSNKQFNSSSDISFGKSLSKLYTGEGGGGGGGEQ